MVHVEKDQKSTIGTMIAIGLVMVLAFFHMMSWGKYAGSIIPLKIKTATGLASAADYRKLAEACSTTGRFDCAEQAYLYEFQISRDSEVVGELASFQMKTENFKGAAETFVKYYQLEGKNPAYAFFYGQTLEKLGEKDRAVRAYQLSIEQNPEMLSLNATSALVRLLMADGKFKEAHQVVSQFHSSADNAKGYLNEEAKILNGKFGVLRVPGRAIASVGSKRIKAVVKF